MDPDSTTHGFAGLTPEQRRELGRKGGRRAQGPGGKGRRWTVETARVAAMKSVALRQARRTQQATA